jgi:hypothetical protein
MQPLLIVSRDGHAGAEPETYRDHIAPAYRARIDDLIEETITNDTVPPDTLDVIDKSGAIDDLGRLAAACVSR